MARDDEQYLELNNIIFVGKIGRKEVILSLTKEEAKELMELKIAVPLTVRTQEAIGSQESSRRN